MAKLIERKDEVKITRENINQRMSEMYEKDHELVDGEFFSLEPGKNCFDFRFKKWKKDDYVQYSLMNRTRYKLPRMVVHHVNHNIHHTSYKEVPGAPGMRPVNTSTDGIFVATENMKLKIISPRCEFRPNNFDAEDDYINQPRLVDVTMHM